MRKHAEYGFKSLAWLGTLRVNMLSCSVARGISDGALIHIIGHVDLKLCSYVTELMVSGLDLERKEMH